MRQVRCTDDAHLLFLPGAGGSPMFWRPLGDLLPADWRKTYLGWPGLGAQPHDPNVEGLDDLVDLAEREIDGPVIIAAQSMGGIIAVRLALRHPDKVRGLVLTVTSGGIDPGKHGASDWRGDYRKSFPEAAPWIMTAHADQGTELHRITAPALLIWGDADPISPVSVGEDLARLLPNARLHVVTGGTHDLAQERAAEVAPLIREHVERCASADNP
jgi:pimeloyl-ACP methyl ester carboxylesterase